MIEKANSELLDVSALSDVSYARISRSLNGIQFPFLIELTFESIPIFSLEILAWLDAPNLFRL
jgi:hypothetical protein